MSTAPAAVDQERSRMKNQVAALVEKHASQNVNALAIVLKADTLFEARIRGYDTPAEARAFAVRAIAAQLSGGKPSEQDISDPEFALGSQANVPDSTSDTTDDAPSHRLYWAAVERLRR